MSKKPKDKIHSWRRNETYKFFRIPAFFIISLIVLYFPLRPISERLFNQEWEASSMAALVSLITGIIAVSVAVYVHTSTRKILERQVKLEEERHEISKEKEKTAFLSIYLEKIIEPGSSDSPMINWQMNSDLNIVLRNTGLVTARNVNLTIYTKDGNNLKPTKVSIQEDFCICPGSEARHYYKNIVQNGLHKATVSWEDETTQGGSLETFFKLLLK